MGQNTHFVQSPFELGQSIALDDQGLVVKVLDDEVVALRVNLDDDGLDGLVALDEDTCG